MRIKYLQKFQCSPFFEQLLYRRPMSVVEIHVFPRCHGAPTHPVCPRCGETMEREYMAFCSRCGQKLDWQYFQYARVVYVEPNYDAIHSETPVHPY